MKKVMLLEPNPYHSEVLPGIVKYFEDLNYIVDVYIREEVIDQNVFCRYPIKGEIIGYKENDIAETILNVEQDYDIIFCSSMEWAENGSVLHFFKEKELFDKLKYKILGMYHSNFLIDRFDDYDMLQNQRLFSISEFQGIDYSGLNMLAPIYFGETSEYDYASDNKITFLSIGTSMDMEKFKDIYWSLPRKDRGNIQLKHIGKKPEESRFADRMWYKVVTGFLGVFIKKYRKCNGITYLGKLSFDEMYEQIEKSDFIIALLKNNDEQYLKYCTSGIRQLILGFNKPCLIQDVYGEKYDISSKSSIWFEGENFENALIKASKMNENQYREMKVNLKKNYEKVYSKSIRNLKHVMENMNNVGISKESI